MSLNSQFTRGLGIADAEEATHPTPVQVSYKTGDGSVDEPTQAFSPGFVEEELAKRRVANLGVYLHELRLDRVMLEQRTAQLLMHSMNPAFSI